MIVTVRSKPTDWQPVHTLSQAKEDEKKQIIKKERRKCTLRASSSLCAFSESPCKDKTNARDNDASRIYAAGASNSRDLCSRMKATTTHAVALSFPRSVFTNEFVNSLNVSKSCDLLAGGPRNLLGRDWRY